MGQLLRPPSKLRVEGRFPSLTGATAWLNSQPLDPEDLQGNVVVVDFCTYTCINWLRTLPYVRAWAEKYREQGLVVIGAHTPEFSFESDLDNVRQALAAMAVEYPVTVDNGYAIWDAFANHYWPALYFIDATGRIRHHWFGEGDYERSETVIQQLLVEAGAGRGDDTLVAVDPRGPEVEADWGDLRSPETYLGSGPNTELRVTWRDGAWASARVHHSRHTAAESLGALRGLDGQPRERGPPSSEGWDLVPVPCARRPSRDGADGWVDAGRVSGVDRRRATA